MSEQEAALERLAAGHSDWRDNVKRVRCSCGSWTVALYSVAMPDPLGFACTNYNCNAFIPYAAAHEEG